jgi:GAF domain-containing protein
MTAPKPSALYDAARLEEIAELGLLDPTPDPVLDAIATAAAERLGMPMGVVSVVMGEAQSFAATHGVEGWMDEVAGTPGEWAFCAHSVESREAFIVEDATTHPLVRDNPLVQADGIRCYAGFPLISSRGHVLGNLCVIGTEDHTFGPEELGILRGLADDVVRHIETRRANG